MKMIPILFYALCALMFCHETLWSMGRWITKHEVESGLLDVNGKTAQATSQELDELFKNRRYAEWQKRIFFYLNPSYNTAEAKEGFKSCLRYLEHEVSAYANPFAAHLLINNYYEKKRQAKTMTDDELVLALKAIILELTVLSSKLYIYAQTEGLHTLYHQFQKNHLASLFNYYRSCWLELAKSKDISFKTCIKHFSEQKFMYDAQRADFFMKKSQDSTQKHDGIKMRSTVDFYFNDAGLVFYNATNFATIDVNERNTLITSKIDEKNTVFCSQLWPLYRFTRFFKELGGWEEFFSYNFDLTKPKSYLA